MDRLWQLDSAKMAFGAPVAVSEPNAVKVGTNSVGSTVSQRLLESCIALSISLIWSLHCCCRGFFGCHTRTVTKLLCHLKQWPLGCIVTLSQGHSQTTCMEYRASQTHLYRNLPNLPSAIHNTTCARFHSFSSAAATRSSVASCSHVLLKSAPDTDIITQIALESSAYFRPNSLHSAPNASRKKNRKSRLDTITAFNK